MNPIEHGEIFVTDDGIECDQDVGNLDAEKYQFSPEKVKELRGFDGIIVPGGFGSRGVAGKIKAIEFCRKEKIPFLGLCLGMQLAVIEFARFKSRPLKPHPLFREFIRTSLRRKAGIG